MATNQHVNKVVYGGTTVIDISPTTAVESDVAQGKIFFKASGEQATGTAQTGGGSAITVTDEQDSHGGTIRHINAVSLAGDTVTAAHLERGYTAHDAQGNAITGTLQPGTTPTLQSKTHITPTESSQTITADTGYDALESVQIDGISSSYVGSGVTRQAAATITPTKSSQTAVAAGRYTTGAVTVAAIPAAYQDVTQVDATAGDVASGKKIVDSSGTVVTGTLTFQTIYSGSSAPSSSTGVNGDIYIQTA